MRVRIGERGGDGVEVGPRRAGPGEPLRFHSHERAREWLRTRIDRHELSALRAALVGAEVAISRRDDDAVLQQLAALLVSGRLVARRLPGRTSAHYAGEDYQPERHELPAPGLGGPPVVEAPVIEEPEGWPALAAQTQARALQAAARDGTPFCEICRRGE